MTLNLRLATVLAVIASAIIMVTGTALAAPGNSGAAKPGWGFGDTNHIHTGPPGQSVRPNVHVSQTNNSSVSSNVNVVSNTGGNSGEDATTGNSNVVVSIITTIGQNIFGWFN